MDKLRFQDLDINHGIWILIDGDGQGQFTINVKIDGEDHKYPKSTNLQTAFECGFLAARMIGVSEDCVLCSVKDVKDGDPNSLDVHKVKRLLAAQGL